MRVKLGQLRGGEMQRAGQWDKISHRRCRENKLHTRGGATTAGRTAQGPGSQLGPGVRLPQGAELLAGAGEGRRSGS